MKGLLLHKGFNSGKGFGVRLGANVNLAFTSPNTFSAPENQIGVGYVVANSGVQYSIVGGTDGSKFSIDAATGLLIFKADQFVLYNTGPDFLIPTDSDSNNIYEVIIRATKSGKTLDQTINVTVTAIANNLKTATVGTQTFYKYNLNSDVTALGFTIPNVQVNATWSTSQSLYDNAYAAQSGTEEQKIYAGVKAAAMWKYYNNSVPTGTVYGMMFNWFAAKLLQMDIDYFNSANPTEQKEYAVSTKADLQLLVADLGGASFAGGKLKETGLTHWSTPNTGATNESGLLILGEGRINVDGTSAALTIASGCWTSDKWKLELANNSSYASVVDRVTSVVQGYAIRLKKKVNNEFNYVLPFNLN